MSELPEALAALGAMITPVAELGTRVQSCRPVIDLDVEAGAGDRVLVIGPDAARTALAFADRGVAQVLACAPPGAELQTRPPEPDGSPQVQLRHCEWQTLDPEREGTFDLVYCEGLLHCVSEPIVLLRRLRALTADGGLLFIQSLILPGAEQSELLKFVPEPQSPWWFIPGRLAMRWMVGTAGFEIEAELGEREGPRDLFPVVSGFLRARAGSATG